MFPVSDSFSSHTNYLEEALTNVGLFTVLDLRASMFSRGCAYVENISDGSIVENDPFIKKLSEPNFSQSQQDFLYSHSFFKGIGNNITRVVAKKPYDIDSVYSLENLIPSQVNYHDVNKMSKMVFSKSDVSDTKSQTLKYNIGGTVYSYTLDELVFFYDITNNLTADSRFKSPSRIDSLIPAIANIHEAQKAKNINLKMSSKHIISSGITDATGMKEGLGFNEKDEIERGLFKKDIFASESNLNVHSLANDFRKLQLDESTNADLLKIANAYGINKEVLSWALDGASTYDNRKFGAIDWIQNSIQAEGDDFANSWSSYFGYLEKGKRIRLDYSHLPVMQILKEKEIEVNQNRAVLAENLIKLGYSNKQAIQMAGLKEMSNG